MVESELVYIQCTCMCMYVCNTFSPGGHLGGGGGGGGGCSMYSRCCPCQLHECRLCTLIGRMKYQRSGQVNHFILPGVHEPLKVAKELEFM